MLPFSEQIRDSTSGQSVWHQSHGGGPHEPAAHLPDVAGLDLCENVARVVQAPFLSCERSEVPTLDTMGAQTFFLIWAELLLSLLTQHQANASESASSGSSERKVERVSELRSRRVSERFRLDVRDSTRD